ncbi:MAG: VCBS repeat-containing protein [Deltaproteobacteria bacterium]|nr:VCBS repeat-containing protein [Deltaproteobacteria bacterium]
MGISLASNNAAVRALSRLSRHSDALGRSFERLSSGLRINSASDDAAGLAISMGLGKDSRVYTQALRNANDGISALNVAGEGLGGANEILFRLKELATQSASGSLSRTQRLSIDKESQALTSEFNRQIGSVDFNGLKLLNAGFGRMNIQVGYGVNGSIGFNIGAELDRNLVSDFSSLTELSASSGLAFPTVVAVEDMNNDGKSDIVTQDDNSLNVLLGNGDGTFGSLTESTFSTIATFGTVADVNGDGKPDLISGSTTRFLVRLGNGNGTFQAEQQFLAGGSVNRVVRTGDFNGDGIMDLAGGSGSASFVRVVFGQGNGNFSSAVSMATAGTLSFLDVGDLNDDGKSDIVAKSGTAASANVFMGSGGSVMSTGQTLTSLGSYGDIQLEDINYDGIKDLIALTSSAILVLNGNGDGTFQNATSISASSVSDTTLQVVDLDGDGIKDITYGSSGLTTLKGNGDGTFASAKIYTNTFTLGYSFIADINNDGAKDFMQMSDLSSSIQVSFAITESTTTLQRIDLTTRDAALNAIALIDAALFRVSGELGAIGATQSRIGSALNTISAAKENSLAAQGRILDVDVAQESSQMARQQILIQSASAVLAQANQLPSLALSLLTL